jgi:dTDP-4-amino-4,6-dideoxygalactose transaminase
VNRPRLSAWPPLPPRVYLRRAGPVPFPLDHPGCKLFALGRHGLWWGVKGLGVGRGDEILAPAFHHGSEIEALLRADVACVFYEGNERLEPDEDELDSLVGPRTRALLLIHYIGFPQDAARWRRWCDVRGLLLFEDCAQAWLASLDGGPVGRFGHLAVFCLYKTFGLPDGSAMLAEGSDAIGRSVTRRGLAPLLRRHADWLMSRSGRLGRLGSAFERGDEYEPERDFELGDPRTRPSSTTLFLLPRIADAGAAAQRRHNYRTLLGSLSDFVLPAFARLPDGASPFFFPIQSERKQELLATLDQQGIKALDFWSVPHPALAGSEAPQAAVLRKSVVGLPIHQELRPVDLEHIATAVVRA